MSPPPQQLVESDEDDAEVRFLKSLTSKQKKKLLKCVFFAIIYKSNEPIPSIIALKNGQWSQWLL